jgi:hypothetical protein
MIHGRSSEILRPQERYNVCPLGMLATYQDVGRVSCYPDNPTYNTWNGIVTDVEGGPGEDRPYLFSVVTGLARGHADIVHEIGMTSEKAFVRTETGHNRLYIRLEADELQNGNEGKTILIAEVLPDDIKQPASVAVLDVGASLLQAVSSVAPAFGKPYDTLRVRTFALATRSTEPFYWDIRDGQAIPLKAL